MVDPETYQDVADGQQGVILAQGPGVMKGYYNDPQGTQKALKQGSWFDTGDLGWRAPGMATYVFLYNQTVVGPSNRFFFPHLCMSLSIHCFVCFVSLSFKWSVWLSICLPASLPD